MTRDHSLDNAKAVLILLVVFAHFLEPLTPTSDMANALYVMIYTFHMPAFVIISGMLAKASPDQQDQKKTALSLLIPFVLFTVLYEIFYGLLIGEISSYSSLLRPFWIMWFLVSLYVWRLLLPYALKLQYPLVTAVLIALAAGYVGGINYTLGLSRMICFFPLFLAGHLIVPGLLKALRAVDLPKLSLAAFSLLALLLFAAFFTLDTRWLYGSTPYVALGTTGLSAGLIRFGLLAFGLLLSVILLALVPGNKSALSRVGRNSLHVFVWHGFFVLLFLHSGLLGAVRSLPVSLSVPLLFAISLALTYALSRSIVARTTQQFLIAPAERLLKRSLTAPTPLTGKS